MELKPMVCLVVLQGAQPKCKFQNKCLLVKGTILALHPCRDLIGRRQTSQSESISPSDSPSSSSSSGGKLSPASEEALCFLYGLRDMDAQVRRNYAARRGHCVVGPDQDRFFYNPICDFSDVAPNDDLSQSIRGDIAIAAEWAEQVPSFHLLSPALRASFLGFKKVVFDPAIEKNFLQKFFHYSDSAIFAKLRAVVRSNYDFPTCGSRITSFVKRHLLRRFCLMFVIIEHGLFTAQMPVHDNVWFLTDRTCLVRDVVAIPEEIKLHMTSKTTMAQQLLYPLTSLLIDEIAQPLRRLRPTPEEVSALKVLMLMKPTIIRESESVPLASSEELRLLSSVRDKILTGLHAYYFVSGEENPEERLSDLLMLSGGVAICAAQELEGLHLLRFFDMARFDDECTKLLFGENDDDDNDDDGDDGGKYDDDNGVFGSDEDDDNDNENDNNDNENDNDNNDVGFRMSLLCISVKKMLESGIRM
uniref:NR LBD domain-containing protein n=1 Tax=Angiostrongylus cantonensis TaxID=6313 RepID=A0A0K0DCA1_ANGCA